MLFLFVPEIIMYKNLAFFSVVHTSGDLKLIFSIMSNLVLGFAGKVQI